MILADGTKLGEQPGKCVRFVQWHDLVEKIEVGNHWFAYSGTIPCTGPVKCIHCGKRADEEG